ncbi:hypothetical protein ACT3SQ_17695 [Brachybacterium sp. AOP42-C2-15]|uniref:hypothetical protein n=1 Tax=Brachybacterium sp. AOP42-C2-15 TaxID=3457670 RepID=UPI004034F35E
MDHSTWSISLVVDPQGIDPDVRSATPPQLPWWKLFLSLGIIAFLLILVSLTAMISIINAAIFVIIAAFATASKAILNAIAEQDDMGDSRPRIKKATRILEIAGAIAAAPAALAVAITLLTS